MCYLPLASPVYSCDWCRCRLSLGLRHFCSDFVSEIWHCCLIIRSIDRLNQRRLLSRRCLSFLLQGCPREAVLRYTGNNGRPVSRPRPRDLGLLWAESALLRRSGGGDFRLLALSKSPVPLSGSSARLRKILKLGLALKIWLFRYAWEKSVGQKPQPNIFILAHV